MLNGQHIQIGGTSWSAPTWGGFCALINQSHHPRFAAAHCSAKVYPLIGTASFRDITAGSNGAYSANAGYDRCTGVGVPNLKTIITTLGGGLPNLAFNQPAGWSDKLVVSNKIGTNTDNTPLSFMDTIYVDYSVINNGGSATTTPFNTGTSLRG